LRPTIPLGYYSISIPYMATKAPCIYVVDDDASVRRALRRLIASNGLPVETFASAAEFLGSEKNNSTGCLILDVRMPGMTGLELQKKLAILGSSLPVIFITAHDDDVAQKQAIENGATAWFMKPVNEHDLMEAIHAASHWQERVGA
jgi:FixJ family two-component response regulator